MYGIRNHSDGRGAEWLGLIPGPPRSARLIDQVERPGVFGPPVAQDLENQIQPLDPGGFAPHASLPRFTKPRG